VNVVLLLDAVALQAGSAADERGVLESVDAVEKVLCDVGHVCPRVGVTRGLAWLDAVRAFDPSVIFNLCEGVDGDTALEASVAAVLEVASFAFTGAPSECLALAHRKDAATALLSGASLPVPLTSQVLDGALVSEWDRFPAIVKPAAEVASVGITQDSVVRDASALTRALAAASSHGSLLVQEFLPGTELNVGIVGSDVLPVAEIVFSGDASLWPIVDYNATWSPGSAEDRATTPVCPARISPALARSARELALDAWDLFGGRGYGRIDLRAGTDGRLRILEVNPNPDLSPDAGLARMAREHGWDYPALVRRILELALDT
jgi:D-alanine-D-alanine ligase